MSSIWRILRGALGTAATWAVVWAVAGFALINLILVVDAGLAWHWDGVRPVTVLAGVSGFVGGAVFSVELGVLHRRRKLHQLKSSRMALWGALAGLLVPLGLIGFAVVGGMPFEPDVVGVIILALGGLGAATAAGTLKLAQASDKDLELPNEVR